MKRPFLLLFSLLCTASLFAQSLSGPESVTWDAATNRYFVSNNGDNKILVRSPQGIYTVFTTNISSGPHGLEIVGNTLYACDGAALKGFDLTSAALVFNVNLGASFLNGICTDGVNNIFVTDFTAKKIFRVNIAQQTFTTFCTGLAKTPNGIFYDQPGGRLVWVTWGTNAPIMQALLSDSSVSQVTATTLGNCDGIVQDGAGNYYVSAWNTNSIYRFTNSFGSPTQVITNVNSPADIYYNLTNDTLVSPNSGTNTVTFHYMGPQTGMHSPAPVSFGLSIAPNPVRRSAVITCHVEGGYRIELLDVCGQLLDMLQAVSMETVLDAEHYQPGIYFIRVSFPEGQEVKKMVILNE